LLFSGINFHSFSYNLQALLFKDGYQYIVADFINAGQFVPKSREACS